MHESFSSGCLFDMGERIRGKRRGESCFPGGFWRTVRRDWGWAPGSWTQTIFWTGRSSCSRHRKKPSGDSVLRHTCCSFSYLWEPAMEKQQILDPDLMFVSNLPAWRILWMPAAGFISLFRVCFQCERRSLQPSASPSPPIWSSLIGREVRLLALLLHYIEPLDSTPPFSVVLSLAVYKPVSFLARADFALTQFSEKVLRQMCESDLYSAPTQHLDIFFVLSWKWSAVIFNIFSPKIFLSSL